MAYETNTYTYDNLNRLTKIEQAGVGGGNAVAEKRVDFAYNAAGQYASIVRYMDTSGGGGNVAAETDYGYDGIGRLTGLTHFKGTTTFADYGWDYDAFSRVKHTVFTSLVGDDGSTTYTYDETNQLTGADHDFQSDETYTYDENGNRTASFDSDPNNRLSADGTFTYDYDLEGNRISRTRISEAPADDFTTEYEWDQHNRLTKVTFKNNGTDITKEIEYTYDVFDRRIKKSIDADGDGEDPATGVEYVYDGQDIVLAFDGDSSLTNRYLHGPGEDNILADEQFSPSTPAEMPEAIGDLFWMLTDNLGSVRDVVDNDGSNVANHITYDGFGQVTSETDDTFNTIAGFQGAERDEETGMQLHDARYYDPGTGVWLSEDPAAADVNLYRYVANAPTNFTDPTGLQKVVTGERDGTKYRVQYNDDGSVYLKLSTAEGTVNYAFDEKRRLRGVVAVAGKSIFNITIDENGNATMTLNGERLGAAAAAATAARVQRDNAAAYSYYLNPSINHLAVDGMDCALQVGTRVGQGMVVAGVGGAIVVEAAGVGGTVIGGKAAVAGTAGAAKAGAGIGGVIEGATEGETAAGAAAARPVLPDDANVVRGGLCTPESIAKGTGTHPSGVTGVSVESAPGKTVAELAEIGKIPNGKIGTTTVGEVRAVGGDVISTSGRSPNHATLTGLDPQTTSNLLSPPIPNPARK